MRFTFSDEQRAFAGSVRDLLARACPPEHVRAMASDPTGRSPKLWKALAELGVVGLAVPAEHGGAGGSLVDLVLPLEEAGRAALPEPLVETAVVAPPLLAGETLRRVAAGDAIVAVGLGRAPLVADAHVAETLLLSSDAGIHAVPAAGVRLTLQPSVDPVRRLFTVEWTPSPETLVVRGEAAQAAAGAAFDRGAIATAAVLCGVADRVIGLAAAYAKERRQFGAPIGSFQAVKHLLADALLGLEFARPLVYRAAWSAGSGAGAAECARDVSTAKAYASDACVAACRAALQVHGAIGYTHEHDLHLWLLRGFALAGAWGSAAWHRDRVARAVLG